MLELSNENPNDSWDVDLYAAPVTTAKKTGENKPKTGSFVPVKGQKAAAKRVQKIEGLFNNNWHFGHWLDDEFERIFYFAETLAKNLKDNSTFQEKESKKSSKTSKTKSPPKRKAANSRRGRQATTSRRRHDDYDLDSSDSDMDEPLARPTQPTYPVHDPNLIVLDCDDVFEGVPAVNFTRNLATASAISVEDSTELKVSVRINGKIESYYMNPVSIRVDNQKYCYFI